MKKNEMKQIIEDANIYIGRVDYDLKVLIAENIEIKRRLAELEAWKKEGFFPSIAPNSDVQVSEPIYCSLCTGPIFDYERWIRIGESKCHYTCLPDDIKHELERLTSNYSPPSEPSKSEKEQSHD